MRGRKRKTIPSFISFEVCQMGQIAASMDDVTLGGWVRQAISDLAFGCVRPDVDPRVKAAYDDAKGRMDSEYERRKSSASQPKASAQAQPQKAPTLAPDMLTWGCFENIHMTQRQHDDLAVEIGNLNDLNKLIDNLSCKVADGSISSANHAATLKSWIDYRKKKAEEKEAEKPLPFHLAQQRHDIELMRKYNLIK